MSVATGATASFWQAAAELDRMGVAFVVATMTATRGSAPQEVGTKAIVTSQGLHFGTVGGGKIEARVIMVARELLAARLEGSLAAVESTQGPSMHTWNLQRDIGMTCGGEVTFLFEVHDVRKWPIAVFGAGHVAQALVRVLATLECHVTCIDHREEWLAKLPEHPRLKKILLAECDEARSMVATLDSRTFFIVMTQGHATDLPILQEILSNRPQAPYVGVMGSDVKSMKMRRELAAAGIPTETIAKLHCPIGIPVGGNEPAEIAISVIAELLRERDISAESRSFHPKLESIEKSVATQL